MWMVQVAVAGQIAHRPHLLGEAASMVCWRKREHCTELPMAHHGDVMATQGGALGGGGFQEAGDARGGVLKRICCGRMALM